jgi:hypothetical protein
MCVVRTARCGCHWSLKANTQVDVKVIATSTDVPEEPVRSGCQGALDGSHILTGVSACESAATSLWPGCRLPPEEQSATAGLVRSNLTRPLVVHETTHPLHAGAPTTLVRQMGARHGSFTGLSRA